MTSGTQRAILLMNLGSPDSTAVRDVKKYLDEFLMDERVIDLPAWRRFLLVKGIIVPFRAPRSAHAYQKIWTPEGSPLIILTNQLQQALEKTIREPVAVAMRYGSPSPETAFRDLASRFPGLQEVLLFPLYPHYAMSSYETAVVYAEEMHKKGNYPFRLSVYPPYYNEAGYIDALCSSIRPYLEQEFDHLLFSYHGVPKRHILKGDCTGSHCLRSEDCCSRASPAHAQCYRHQCYETTRLVAQKLGLGTDSYSVSFQSRLGREEWLKPYTAERLTSMPAEGIRRLLVVCPAFVSDCLETLEEIAQEGKTAFMGAGGQSFTAIPCLNTHPAWVDALAGMVNNFDRSGN